VLAIKGPKKKISRQPVTCHFNQYEDHTEAR